MVFDAKIERKLVAKRAALSAAENFSTRISRGDGTDVSNFALYAWGSLACVCALFAVSATTLPDTEFDPMVVAAIVTGLPESSSLTREPSFNATAGRPIANAPKDVPILASRPAPNMDADFSHMANNDPDAPDAGNTTDAMPVGSISPNAYQPYPDDVATVSSESFSDSGMGVQIGGSASQAELAKRFDALARRAPQLFYNVTGKAHMTQAGGALVAGPFGSAVEVANFCRSLKLQLTMDCAPSEFKGTIVARR